jgi:hypothetical protein
MTDEEFQPILEAVISKTRFEGFRAKTDPTSPAYVPGMRESVMMIHRGEGRRARVVEPSRERVAKPYPPLLVQAQNAIGAAVTFVACGCKIATDAEREQRLEICRVCEHFDAGPQRCRKCACFMAVKTYSKAEKCPIGKW